MSKKIKRGSMESSSFGGYEDTKAMLKHQALFQEFQELQRETNGFRDKLEDAKKRKLILLAEVRFLRRRHKYLLQVKSMDGNTEEQKPTQPRKLEKTHPKTGATRPNKKEAAPLRKLPPLPCPKQKGKISMGRETTKRVTVPTPPSTKHKRQKTNAAKEQPALPNSSFASDSNHGSNHGSRTYGGKDTVFQSIDLNQNERLMYGGGSSAVSRSHVPLFDLNKESSHGGKEVSPPSRAPFDLNEISTEEEPRWNFEPVLPEEQEKGLMRGGSEDQHGDLRISLCRNAGEGTSRARKPKISWQDPVALRV